MRRLSLTHMSSQSPPEPLIVVEETEFAEEDESKSNGSTPRQSFDMDSPLNPYLLSPWRDTRKHSLPTPACTSGPTASQVRRLSERGEGAAKEAREAAFLATLSQAPPQQGGRRHSVVTISRVPQSLFGRGRRESVAAFPAGATGLLGSRTLLQSRRESVTSQGPPSTEHRGSTHNLQLDIMDDIVAARKVRMKMWNTSNERVCEVQPLDERQQVQRYTNPTPKGFNPTARRHSDFMGTALAPIPSNRRASELPPPPTPGKQGIVCSNTDLISILTNLTSSATEIDRCGQTPAKEDTSKPPTVEQKRKRLKDSRSNSFDVSVLNAVKQNKTSYGDKSGVSPSSWFIKRHQTLANKSNDDPENTTTITFASETAKPKKAGDPKVIWDKPTGSMVDPQVLGSAIEVFLRQTGAADPTPTPAPSQNKGAIPKIILKGNNKKTSPKKSTQNQGSSWYSGKSEDEESADTCDTSICSTLKDLFVK